MPNGNFQPLRCKRIKSRTRIRGIEAERFFAEHMLPGIRGRHNLVEMDGMRRRQNEGIDIVIRQNVLIRRMKFYAFFRRVIHDL